MTFDPTAADMVKLVRPKDSLAGISERRILHGMMCPDVSTTALLHLRFEPEVESFADNWSWILKALKDNPATAASLLKTLDRYLAVFQVSDGGIQQVMCPNTLI
ncbi:hypothetical protein RvY_00831-2 [Ramazzottius varieornatus]|uniref:Uncharacterized protein n=1 Tax=Ramazzottius varieornatus TaxID=947166 RepID=A0A1D1UEK6_RAMVA|nr:hypothetical protein RvY_00831-2 [Ramazzottius varieornatus]